MEQPAADTREQALQQAYWDEDKAARRGPEHPAVVATFEPLAALVASAVRSAEQSSVLDVGCGNGFLTRALERRFATVVGVDYSRQMLAVNPCPHLGLASSTRLPFADRSFDVVVASHLLHHLVAGDRGASLREMGRVARTAVVSFEPNRNNPLMLLFALAKREERMAMRFTRGYVERLFRQQGFESVAAHVEGWMVPNKAPTWWAGVARVLGRTPLRRLGVDICCVAKLSDECPAS